MCCKIEMSSSSSKMGQVQEIVKSLPTARFLYVHEFQGQTRFGVSFETSDEYNEYWQRYNMISQDFVEKEKIPLWKKIIDYFN